MSFSISCIYNCPLEEGVIFARKQGAFLSKSGQILVKGRISKYGSFNQITHAFSLFQWVATDFYWVSDHYCLVHHFHKPNS